MINEKIDRVLKNLEEQETFERKNPSKVSHSEKLLAVTRKIGLFYNILLRSNKAKKILEIGTSAGYSTLWFAEAISSVKDGKIITIEQDEKKIARAKKNFDEAGVSHLIEIKHGNALEILPEIQEKFASTEKFDFVFIDADKERYIQYFDLVFPMLKTGGLIGADNILWPEKYVSFIEPYLEYVKNNPKVRSITIPIDNGEELSLKILH